MKDTNTVLSWNLVGVGAGTQTKATSNESVIRIYYVKHPHPQHWKHSLHAA